EGGYTLKQLKALSFEEVKEIFEATMRKAQRDDDGNSSRRERGHDIYMLVEKDYPLTKALAILMLCNKLRVDQYSDMADELL
ncbi:hypothetical protein Tco_0288749, partial [Tanacetum coccineum]